MILKLIQKLFRPNRLFVCAVNTPHIETQEAAKAFTRLFATEDGQKVLGYLQRMTFQRVLGPESPDSHIRYNEGQRAVMAMILRMIERGARRPQSPENKS